MPVAPGGVDGASSGGLGTGTTTGTGTITNGGGGNGHSSFPQGAVVLDEDEVEPEYVEFIAGRWRAEGLGREADFVHHGPATASNGHNHHHHHSHGNSHRNRNRAWSLPSDPYSTLPSHDNNNFNGGPTKESGKFEEEEEEEEDDRALYAETVKVPENPLTVTEEDALKKRYKAYRKWLRGKSLFKQQPVD